jgi:hypothetical protein
MRVVYVLLGFIGVLALLAAVPTLLSMILDPLNAHRVRKYCERLGLNEISIEPFPNHYGVRFSKDGLSFYAKCRVVRREIRWKGRSPEELLSSQSGAASGKEEK